MSNRSLKKREQKRNNGQKRNGKNIYILSRIKEILDFSDSKYTHSELNQPISQSRPRNLIDNAYIKHKKKTSSYHIEKIVDN